MTVYLLLSCIFIVVMGCLWLRGYLWRYNIAKRGCEEYGPAVLINYEVGPNPREIRPIARRKLIYPIYDDRVHMILRVDLNIDGGLGIYIIEDERSLVRLPMRGSLVMDNIRHGGVRREVYPDKDWEIMQLSPAGESEEIITIDNYPEFIYY